MYLKKTADRKGRYSPTTRPDATGDRQWFSPETGLSFVSVDGQNEPVVYSTHEVLEISAVIVQMGQ
jgi:hypothetical protein